MKKNAYFAFAMIFCLILLLNCMKPLSSDDYFCAFIWPAGVKLNGLLPENAGRIASFADIFKSVKEYYFVWGGRLPAQSLMTFFVWQGKILFNIFNSFVFLLLIAEIYWLSHEGKVGTDFDASYIVWIFFSLWSFNVSFNDTVLWIAGSCTYLWMMAVVLAFLIPYVRNYYDHEACTDSPPMLVTGMLATGFLAGCSFEVIICWIILALSYWLYLCKKRSCLQRWQIAGYIGLCSGYIVLLLSPGNYARLASEHTHDQSVLSPEVFVSNIMENVVILTFHLILWYFLLKFLYGVGKNKDFKNLKVTDPYFSFIKVCAVMACCSMISLIIIPSGGYRTSFCTLIFLTTAVAAIFRFCQNTKIALMHNNGKLFLKIVGICYLIMSISFSIWGNYVNWNHWNAILATVKEAKYNHREVIVLAEPYPISENSKINLLSGFHISQMPFRGLSETDEINRTFARYYGIKGIKVSR